MRRERPSAARRVLTSVARVRNVSALRLCSSSMEVGGGPSASVTLDEEEDDEEAEDEEEEEEDDRGELRGTAPSTSTSLSTPRLSNDGDADVEMPVI